MDVFSSVLNHWRFLCGIVTILPTGTRPLLHTTSANTIILQLPSIIVQLPRPLIKFENRFEVNKWISRLIGCHWRLLAGWVSERPIYCSKCVVNGWLNELQTSPITSTFPLQETTKTLNTVVFLNSFWLLVLRVTISLSRGCEIFGTGSIDTFLQVTVIGGHLSITILHQTSS